MMDQPHKKPHILFLFSDTGGGHRSAAEAIIEAIRLNFKDSISTEMVDIFKEYAPAPLNNAPAWYPRIVRVPQAWGLGYYLSDGHTRARLFSTTTWPYIRRSARQLVENHPANVIVSVHPLANAPIIHALKKDPYHPPYITVVTDLVSGHALWYHRRTDLCIVPTEASRQRALECGLTLDQVQVIGLPVADRFCRPASDQGTLRARLGWPQNLPVVLLVGGGEGMGPLKKTAYAIAKAGLPLSLVVIAGRNQELKQELEASHWPIPTFIYGFLRDMPDFMQAADVLVSKAGPGTISEALNAGLPIILYSRLPGQEDGNVSYIVSEGAGVWAPNPNQIVSALREWINYPEKRRLASAACRRLARPQAARQIAHILADYMNIKVTP
jgi:1,2-diacylglycerol 3-beta-galactosyltransferase